MAGLFAAGTLAAQESQSEGFKKGDTFLTGNVGYYTTKNDATKVNNFSISPEIGHFVTDNIALAAFVSYTSAKNEDLYFNTSTKNTTYGAGVFARYYFTPANKFSFFGNLGASYNSNKVESSADELTGNGFSIQAGPGINYFISPRFSLHTFVGVVSYGTSKTKYAGYEDKTTGFNASLNLSNVSFGLTYKL